MSSKNRQSSNGEKTEANNISHHPPLARHCTCEQRCWVDKPRSDTLYCFASCLFTGAAGWLGSQIHFDPCSPLDSSSSSLAQSQGCSQVTCFRCVEGSTFYSIFCDLGLLFLLYVWGHFRCCRGRSFTWLLAWRRSHLLQPSDSVFQFAVQSLVLGQQTRVTRLQQVQSAAHALHLLFHLFWVRALCCHLQDRRG